MLLELAAQDEGGEPKALVGAENGKAEELRERVHRDEPLAVPEAVARRPEVDRLVQAELAREPEDAVVRRQDHVVEAVGRGSVEVEGADEAAEIRRSLVERYTDSLLQKAVRARQAEDSSSDDSDGRGAHPATDPFTSRR